MTSRGLKASPEGIKAAKTALTDKTLSQQRLAAALGITRQPVSKFFAGEPVSRSCFVQICQKLGLSWQQVASVHEEGLSKATSQPQSHSFDLNILVQELRQKCHDKIQDQCSTIQMLDIARAIPLDQIYTHVNVWEEITSQQWREISDLWTDSPSDANFYQLGQSNHPKTLAGLEAVSRYSKLMVLGKSGSGKTTFLQHLAIACNQGKFQSHYVPVLVRLKEFAEDAKSEQNCHLGKYISQQFQACGIDEEVTLPVLTQGRVLILLDGLDEVPLDYRDDVIREIRKFTQINYKNQFVISCRIAAHKYRFPGFTEVELADFNDQQIEIFLKNWLVAVAHQSISKAEATSNLFLQHLKLPENQHILELVRVPLLLHLICLLLQVKGKLPSNTTKLYEQILNTLLLRWDEIRGIKRDSFYANLSLSSKKNLLAQIAATTFINGEYFFELEKIQQLIDQFLPSIDNLYPDTSQRYLDRKSMLEGLLFQDGLLMERARGIYSFSNLGLLEYLTAKHLVENYQQTNWQLLISNIKEHHWYSVFMLILTMLPNTDATIKLIKNEINRLVVNNQKLQEYLIWLKQKTDSVSKSTTNKAAAVRAFYFTHGCTAYLRPNYSIEWDFLGSLVFHPELALDELLFSILNCLHELKLASNNHLNIIDAFNYARALSLTLDEAIDLVWEVEFKQELEKLKKQLPCTESNSEKFYSWWQEQGISWEQKIRYQMMKYRSISYDLELDNQQIKIWRSYFNANKLIIDYLEKNASVSQELQQQIEEQLFLAIADNNP